jgi:hypothetical protein
MSGEGILCAGLLPGFYGLGECLEDTQTLQDFRQELPGIGKIETINSPA